MSIKLEDIDSETMQHLAEIVIEKLKVSQSQTTQEIPAWYADTQQVPTFPVNIVHADIGPSQISVLFGITDPLFQLNSGSSSVRLIFTHDDFVRIMDFLDKRSAFLRQSYEGTAPSLDAHPEAVNEALPLLNTGGRLATEQINS